MANNPFRTWLASLFDSLVASAVWSSLAGVGMVALTRLGPSWTHSIIYGLLTSLLMFLILLAWRVLKVLPPSSDRTTADNIEMKLRSWLDRTQLTVQNSPTPETLFRLIVTTDAGRKVIVGRPKEGKPDYLHFRAEITTTEADRKELDLLSEGERNQLMLELKLGLARARVGYSGLTSLDGLAIFKSIPITHSLGEHEVILSIWEMEAVLNEVFMISALAVQRKSIKDVHLLS